MILEDYLEHVLNHDTINKIKEIKFKIKKEISQISKTSDIEIKDLSNDQYTVNHIQSFLLPKGYQAQLIQSILSKQNKIYIGVGSACSSINYKYGSYVLTNMGYSQEESFGLLRFSFLDNVHLSEIEDMSNHLYGVLNSLKKINDNQKINQPKQMNDHIIIKNPNTVYNRDYIDITDDYSIEPDYPKFNTVKLSVGELYLKGCNKDKYIKRLVGNLHDSLHIPKGKIGVKEDIIIVRDSEINIYNYQKIPGIAKIQPCAALKRTGDNQVDLKELLSILMGCIESFLDENDIKLRFRLTFHYLSTQFYGLKVSELINRIGQYIRKRFGDDKVVVDLTNYDLNINVNFYKRIILVSTQSLKGLGGLPSGSSGTAGIIVEEFFDAKRLNTCIKMILSRGSFYKLIKSDDEINDVSYLVIEPTNYNDKDIYNKQEYLEKKFNKPVLTITNLIEQDNLEDMEINFLNKIPINNYNISGDVPIKPFNNILMMLSGGIDSPVASYLL